MIFHMVKLVHLHGWDLAFFNQSPERTLYFSSVNFPLALQLFVEPVLEGQIHYHKSGLGRWS